MKTSIPKGPSMPSRSPSHSSQTLAGELVGASSAMTQASTVEPAAMCCNVSMNYKICSSYGRKRARGGPISAVVVQVVTQIGLTMSVKGIDS